MHIAIVALALALGSLVRSALMGASLGKKPQRLTAGRVLSAVNAAMPISQDTEREVMRSLQSSGTHASAQDIWAATVMLAALGAIVGLVLASGKSAFATIGLTASLGAIGAVVPRIWLALRRRAWRAEIEEGIPAALDMLTICMQSGATFDYALRVVAARSEGAVAEAFGDVVRASRFSSTSEALGKLAKSANVRSLTMFAASLAQAERSGMRISQVVASQAAVARRANRAKMDEKINKLSVKLVMPLILFLVGMLILTLAPVVSQLVKQLAVMS